MIKQNEYGFTLVSFNQMFSFSEHFFLFPIHVEQMNEHEVKWFKNNRFSLYTKCIKNVQIKIVITFKDFIIVIFD
jgi:hypothetical protein